MLILAMLDKQSSIQLQNFNNWQQEINRECACVCVYVCVCEAMVKSKEKIEPISLPELYILNWRRRKKEKITLLNTKPIKMD